jgi:hypothetical protein
LLHLFAHNITPIDEPLQITGIIGDRRISFFNTGVIQSKMASLPVRKILFVLILKRFRITSEALDWLKPAGPVKSVWVHGSSDRLRKML